METELSDDKIFKKGLYLVSVGIIMRLYCELKKDLEKMPPKKKLEGLLCDSSACLVILFVYILASIWAGYDYFRFRPVILYVTVIMSIMNENNPGVTLLHVVSWSEYPNLVKLVISLTFANLEAKVYGEFTPLIVATMFSNDTVVKQLLSRGANAGAKLKDGSSILHLAENRKVAQAILESIPRLQAHSSDDANSLSCKKKPYSNAINSKPV